MFFDVGVAAAEFYFYFFKEDKEMGNKKGFDWDSNQGCLREM